MIGAGRKPGAAKGVGLRRLVRPTRPGARVLVRRRVDRDPAVAEFGALTGRAFQALRRIVERKLQALER